LWQKHLHLVPESAWGEYPASPTPIYLPYARYDVRPRPRIVQASGALGLRQRRHQQLFQARLAGELVAPLFSYHAEGGSIAELLIAWLFSAPASAELLSFAIDVAEPGIEGKRHLGLRPAAGSIIGAADAGAIHIALQLEGKEEVAPIAPPAIPSSTPRPIAMLFKDCEFTLDGVPTPLARFEIRIENQLRPHHNNSFWPSVLAAGRRELALRLRAQKTDAAFDAMRRGSASEPAAQLVLKGTHDSTGPPGTSQTRVTFDFPRLAFADVAETGGRDELAVNEIELVPLKPTGAANDVTITFDAI
jgi:hypothetical protein